MFALYFRNLALSIVTLGVYRFWAKTRLRQFQWSNTQIDGEPFEYTGTGKELFIGFLKALAILTPIFGALTIAELMTDQENKIAAHSIDGMRTLVFLVLIYAGTYAARRYRMSRTLWRAIRFQQTGSAWRYAGTALLGLFVTAITLGLYLPFMQASLMRFETENLRFGSKPFMFTGAGGKLFRRYIRIWIIAVCILCGPTLRAVVTGADPHSLVIPVITGVVVGVIALPLFGAWYRVHVYRFQAEHTHFDSLNFSYPALTGSRLLWLTVSNWLLTIFSLTLLTPLVLQRSQQFWTRHLMIEGNVDFAAITQAASGPASGEGLAGFFNIDLS